MTPATSAASAYPAKGLAGAQPMVDALLRVSTAALSVSARLTVVRADEIDAMTSAKSAATAQLGRLCERVVLAGDRLVLADIPRTTDRVASDHDARSFAGLPLISGDGPAFGVLVATTEQPGLLTDRDLGVLADAALGVAEALAAHTALVTVATESESHRGLLDEASRRQTFVDAILDTIEVGIVACDADGGWVLINRVGRELTALVPQDTKDRNWVDWSAFEADGVTPTRLTNDPLHMALDGRPVEGVLIVVPHSDGTSGVLRCHARQLRDADGNVAGAVAACADITDLAHTSDALREARDRAEAIIATVIDGFISAGPDGVVREWNPAAERITGWTAQEAIGRTVSELIVPPEERPYLDALFSGNSLPEPKLVGSGLTRQMNRKDGSPIMVEMTSWNTSHRGELRYNAFMRDVTDAQAQSAAIAAAHAEFTAALDAMPRSVTLANVVRDENGEPDHITIRWCNQHLLQTVGRPLSELVGRAIKDLTPTLIESGWHDKYLEVARTGVPISTTADWFEGELIAGAFDLVITPLDRDTLLIENTDITESVLAKRDLERSERMVSVSNRAAGMGSSWVDLRTGKWTWSRSTFEIFGLNADTDQVPDGATFRSDIVHPDDLAIYDRQWTEITAGQPQSCEYRIRRPDGRIRHLLNWAEVETDAEGTVVAVVLGVQDQTDRREREIALAQSRELEGLVIDRSPIGIAFLDEDGRYLQVNAAFCHMLGRTREELLASNFLDITHPDERAAGLTRHRDLIAGKMNSFAHDKRYLHANGRVLWVSVHKTVLQSSDKDQPVRVLSQIIDISKRQEQTDELTRQARTDALTGLANRRGWEPRLHAALADAQANGRNLCVAILDLDKFKNFNDTYGHPVGDQLLAETSRAWRAHLIRKAPSALLARLGGEEFGVLMPNTDDKKARALLEAMIGLVVRDQTASAGYSIAHPSDDARTLMTRADNALYTAKNNGRARVESALE